MASKRPNGVKKRASKRPPPFSTQPAAHVLSQAGDGIAFQGRRTTVRLKQVVRPDGSSSVYEIVERPDAVAVVALRTGDEGELEVALVSQPRPALDKELLEIPAGIIEPHERDSPAHAAARELLEETGLEASELHMLVAEYPSPGYTTEVITIYLAGGVHQASDARPPDPSEITRLSWLSLDEAIHRVRTGEIRDGKTVLGLWLARDEVASGSFQT